eukprot:TRINITY_DN51650_c0_g1_i1.p1 TRINITY_DN51650_c0_g1~~TRINITY_DN51650_c0_g1_i1.p1  ORF type:complete len:440 (-),score=70.26 TRINITY_DN51650_c0_g1_i1:8-1327(-)
MVGVVRFLFASLAYESAWAVHVSLNAAGQLHLQTQSASRSSSRYTVYGEDARATYFSAPCSGDVYSQNETLDLLSFWTTADATPWPSRTSVPLIRRERRRYLTFDSDNGGFNNIRMAFEYYTDLALKSNRTLVLPPKQGWYLIDWGPLNSHHRQDKQWIPAGSWSTYEEFWDIGELSSRMSVMSASEFFKREFGNLGIPSSLDPDTLQPANAPDHSDWKDWLRAHGTWAHSCEEGRSLALDSSVQHVHLPVGRIGNEGEYRFLDCPDRGMGARLLHFHPSLFAAASAAISELGLGRYAALHLRRNDFQYSQAPTAEGSRALLDQIRAHLREGEAIYIASDELDHDWWAAFRIALAETNHSLVRAAQFLPLLEARGLTRRHLGVVEMILCAGARLFMGTPLSTFSAGILQMRHRIAKKNKMEQARKTLHEYHDEELFIQI